MEAEAHHSNLQRYSDMSGVETGFLKSCIICVLDVNFIIKEKTGKQKASKIYSSGVPVHGFCYLPLELINDMDDLSF